MATTTASVDFTTLISSTFNNSRADINDAIFRKSSFMARMHMNGRKILDEGGPQIQRNLEYGTNTTIKSLEGYDPIDLTPQEEVTVSLERWAEVAGSIAVSRREERINSGSGKIFDLVNVKINNFKKSFAENLNTQLLAPTGTSGAAPGNGGKDLVPLTQIISLAANTVHGISSSTNTWWDNQRSQSAATTYAGLKREWKHNYYLTGLHNDGFADIVLTDLPGYELYQDSMQGQIRYGSQEMANLGFDTVRIHGAELLWDQICPGADGSNALVVYPTANTASNYYYINTNFLALVVDRASDIVLMPFQESQDQLARSAKGLFMGNFVCTNRRTQGVLYDVTATITS